MEQEERRVRISDLVAEVKSRQPEWEITPKPVYVLGWCVGYRWKASLLVGSERGIVFETNYRYAWSMRAVLRNAHRVTHKFAVQGWGA